MPLPPPDTAREPLHTRQVTCTGYRRADGLWDIEGHITDRKSYDFQRDGRTVPSGDPIHEMWIRLTLDNRLTVKAVAAVTDAAGDLVQIGAYSSEAAARAAWARLDLDGLTPVYEAAEVGGRRLTRLKVRAPAAGAAAVCAAAGIDDPWCRRGA